MKEKKVRISLWIDPELWILAKRDGLSFTTMMDQILSKIYEVTPDPDRVKFHERKDKSMDQILEIYKVHKTVQDQENIRQDIETQKLLERQKLLQDIGGLLEKSKYKSDLLKDLQRKTMDQEDSWYKFNQEVQKKIRNGWDPFVLYNHSLEWFRLYRAPAQSTSGRS